MTVSTPRSACRLRRASPSRARSPRASCTSTRCRPRRLGSRTRARTGSPESSSRGSSALPIVPVAPVSRITRRTLARRPSLECPLRRGTSGLGCPADEDEAKKGSQVLAYVIAEPCIGQKDNSCVEVCPVDCIHPTPDEPDYDNVEQLYIDPEECIDCDACVEACPVDACFAEDQLPNEWAKFTEINAQYYKNGA